MGFWKSSIEGDHSLCAVRHSSCQIDELDVLVLAYETSWKYVFSRMSDPFCHHLAFDYTEVLTDINGFRKSRRYTHIACCQSVLFFSAPVPLCYFFIIFQHNLYLFRLIENFVIVPADEASNNYIFVFKRLLRQYLVGGGWPRFLGILHNILQTFQHLKHWTTINL